MSKIDYDEYFAFMIFRTTNNDGSSLAASFCEWFSIPDSELLVKNDIEAKNYIKINYLDK